MESNRRSFLKIGGICALGLGALPVVDAFAKAELPQFGKMPQALEAKQWAMVIDMKKCWASEKKDCVDCINACHKVHNVPEIGTIKEEIKWIWNEPYENAFPGTDLAHNELREKPFVVLCNHCTNPPCTRVCPTKATWKRPENGIVMMDFHRCIGCRYCMAACPFGARSFNFRDPRPYLETENMEFPTRERGVVEKCNFCAERLAKGLIPACVEACKAKALVFGDVEDPNSEVRKLLGENFTMRRRAELGTGPNVYYIL